MNEVIDLLDSGDESVARASSMNDDDDEIEFIGVTNASTTVHQSSSSLSFANKKSCSNSQNNTEAAQKTPAKPSSPSATKATPKNPYAKKPARVSLEPSNHPTPRTVHQRPKNPYKTPKSTPRAVSQSSQSAYDSDSDDDLIMNGGPTFSTTTSRTDTHHTPKATTQTTSSTSTTSVSNVQTTNTASNVQTTKASSPPVLASPPDALASVMATTRTSPPPDAPFLYPALLHNSKQYIDLRPNYILAFWRFARTCTQHSYKSKSLDQVCNKILLLALTPHPIRSLEEYCFGRGHGGSADTADQARRDNIQKQLEIGGLNTTVITTTPSNQVKKYTSIVEACLVAMKMETERRLTDKDINPRVLDVMDDASIKGMLGEKDMWISLEDLIPAIDALLKPECPGRMTRANDNDNGAAHYADPTTKSAEFLQIRKLEKCHSELGDYDVGRIKRHTQRGKLLFELTHVGYKSAKMVQERQFPLPPSFYRTSRIQKVSQVQESFKNICVGVDLREGGGGHRALHEMCNTLDVKKLPFFVASLKIGDYVFFTRGPSGSLNYLCPILVERKSIEDIALSISDGRWKSQKQRMYHGQFVFGYNSSRMVYIIEGKEEKQQVTGGYIGHRMHGVDMQRLKDEIENLRSEGFNVLRTPSRKQTMFEIARWAEKVAQEMESGVLTAEYTYAEFSEEVKKIPRDTDFSRLAKYEAQSREQEPSAAAASTKRPYDEVDLDSDSDIEILEVSSPPMMYERKPPARPTSQRRSPLIDHKKKAAERTFSRGDIASLSDQRRSRTPLTDSKKPVAARSSHASSERKKPARPSSAKKVKIAASAVDYSDWTKKQLEDACVKCGIPKTGKKSDLIERLQQPLPPKLWLRRKEAGEYVPPRHNVGNVAVLVALYLHEKDAGDGDRGLSKEELFAKAEGLCITKNPFCGGTTQTGPFHYDGMSGMKELTSGDPPLVKQKKREGYKLTRCGETAGYPFAEALHKWCHAWGNCKCGATDL